MPKFDRHNEVEVNFLPEGSLTYLFHGHRETVFSGRLSLFWGLVPHQIVDYEGEEPYYVGTIPFALFLSWGLPSGFVEDLLEGSLLTEVSDDFREHDCFLWKNWLEDVKCGRNIDVTLWEMKARLMRMADHLLCVGKTKPSVQEYETSLVEKMAIYIARNYFHPLKIADIGKAVGLHPDYANYLFRKAFKCTLSDYVTEERIAHAQRKLLSSRMSITEIAFDCGFSSIGRFNKAFLKICGCTPREFRQNNRM